MYLLLEQVIYTQVSSLLLGIYFLDMAKPLLAAVSALCLHLPGDGVSFYWDANSPESHGAFAWWVWINTLGCLYPILWYLPPFSFDTTTAHVGPSSWRSCVLGSVPPSSKGSYTSQPILGISGSWPEEISPEDSWDVIFMILKVPLFLWRESWGSQCQCLASRAIKASPACLLTTTPTCNPPACPLLILI